MEKINAFEIPPRRPGQIAFQSNVETVQMLILDGHAPADIGAHLVAVQRMQPYSTILPMSDRKAAIAADIPGLTAEDIDFYTRAFWTAGK